MPEGDERRKESAAAYAEVAELAGSFIHEIKNHLSTLGLNLQLLAEDLETPKTQGERRAVGRVKRLQSECQHLVDLSNDFLRFAKITDLELIPTDVASVVDEMVDFFAPTARQTNIAIHSYVPSNLPMVLLDRDLFRQALLNLMLNAEQAMPEGGELTIQGMAEDDWVKIHLIDTGRGMAPEVLSRIYQPFFSTKPEGTGLGLPTTRKIVRAHGGTLDVQSEVDRGTKFTLRLPAAEAIGTVAGNR